MDEQNNLNQELTDAELTASPVEQTQETAAQTAAEGVQESVAQPVAEPTSEPAATPAAQATPTMPRAQYAQAPMQGNYQAPVWGQGAPNPYQPPQWYGVSYQGNYTTTVHPENGGDAPKKKKGKFRKVAMVALLLVACILYRRYLPCSLNPYDV